MAENQDDLHFQVVGALSEVRSEDSSAEAHLEGDSKVNRETIEGETPEMAEEIVNNLTNDQIRDLAEALQKELANPDDESSAKVKNEREERVNEPPIDPDWIIKEGLLVGESGGTDVTDDVYVKPEDRFTVNELKLKMEKQGKLFISTTADKGLLALEHDYCVEKMTSKGERKVTEEKRVLRSSTRPSMLTDGTQSGEGDLPVKARQKTVKFDVDEQLSGQSKGDRKTLRSGEEREGERKRKSGRGSSGEEQKTEGEESEKVKERQESGSEEDKEEEEEKEKEEEEEEDEDDDDEEEEEDDNDKTLYCVCRKPHQNRFMICCDRCEEWFHGNCVGISVERGQEMDMNDEEYVCPSCRKKAKQQQKLAREKAMTSKLEGKRHTGKHELRKRGATLETVQSEMRNQKALTRTRIGGRKPSSLADYIEDDDWLPVKVQTAEPAEEKPEPELEPKLKLKLKKPKPAGKSVQICVKPGCKKVCPPDTLYCSEECLKKYAKYAMNRFDQAIEQQKNAFSSHPSAIDRVPVIDRTTGRTVGGMAAPRRESFFNWLKSHQMHEVALGGAQVKSVPKEARSFRLSSSGEDRERTSTSKMSMNVKLIRNNVVKSLKQILSERNGQGSERMDEKDVLILCRKIEKHLFRVHEGEVGQKYKAKYRTLMFNLKDSKNQVLYKDVLNGRLKPSELVLLSSEELASKELAKWRKEENKKTLELIKEAELQAAKEKVSITKMTHKGEIEIEQIIPTIKTVPVASNVLDILSVDSTAQHQSHVFSVNCKICTGKEEATKLPGKKEEKKSVKEEEKVEVKEENPEIQKVEEQPPREPSPPALSTDDVIDIDIHPPSPLPLIPPEVPGWKGLINMQGVAKFSGAAYVVSGPIPRRGLSGILPEACSVQGRIAENQVWDYIKKLKYSSNRDVSLIRIEPANENEKGFSELFTYMKEKHRFVVVVNCLLPIKDMYLMPLPPSETVPNFLKPFSGPGLPNGRGNLIIGIIVKQTSRQKRYHGSRDSLHHHHSKPKRAAAMPSSLMAGAPVNLAKKGYFHVPTATSYQTDEVTHPFRVPSPMAIPATSEVGYSPVEEVYSPSKPSVDDNPSFQSEDTDTSKPPSSAVSAILSAAMARAGGGRDTSTSRDSSTQSAAIHDLPLLGGGGISVPLLGESSGASSGIPPLLPPVSSSLSVSSPPPIVDPVEQEPPSSSSFSSTLMQAVKAMSTDTLQNIAQAVGFMKNQNPAQSPEDFQKHAPLVSLPPPPPPLLPPSSSSSLQKLDVPFSVSAMEVSSSPPSSSLPPDPSAGPPLVDPKQLPSDPRRPPNWGSGSPPRSSREGKRSRWNENDANGNRKMSRWDETGNQPRQSHWDHPSHQSEGGLLPLPPEHQRLDQRFESEESFRTFEPDMPQEDYYREVDPRFEIDHERRVGPSERHFRPPLPAEGRFGPSEERMVTEGRLGMWHEEPPDRQSRWYEERERYGQERELGQWNPGRARRDEEDRRSKMPKELREYIEATKRELRETNVVDQGRERRDLPLGYQSAVRVMDSRDSRQERPERERESWRDRDRDRDRERDSPRYKEERGSYSGGGRGRGEPRWGNERDSYYREESRDRRERRAEQRYDDRGTHYR